ncbi:NAD(P)/FAD-dependent oxidoreductase [Mesoterricola silvestris]|uniref:FAD-dependent oxidoreductase n=1 Tax=Mesoterricola silvestris TaxID=2927979 RepID=A0AA48GQD0_9BACT|nr:FAD-binding oxidoreductase [Mesoterricola silvestris]BDU72270.1 FAD-dependent oxidoreductase [Mesoterricola silvestris]
MRRFDVVVVGAGIGGGSFVYNLLKQGFTGSILVVDRGDAVSTGASAYSAGGFRNLWTTPINQQLCTRGIGILKAFQDDMGVGIGFRQTGYLFTYYPDAWSRVPDAARIWKANGVDFELLDPAQVEARIPGLRCAVDAVDPDVRDFLGMEPIAGGVFGRDCGSFDPSQAAAGYFERALQDHPGRARLELRTEAEALVFDPAGRVTGLRVAGPGGREVIEAGLVALCSGPWTNPLLKRSGCPDEDLMPILAQKRMMFLTDFPDQDPRWQDIPLTIIDQGIYFKHESGNLLIGKAKADTPDSLDTTFEPDYYVEEINLVMQERMPPTATCRLKGGWAGLYDTTGPDHNAILGWHANHPGLLLQVGYSGHGAMESPAVGIGLAELVMTGGYRSIDLTPLRWSRFREGDLVKETIVI